MGKALRKRVQRNPPNEGIYSNKLQNTLWKISTKFLNDSQWQSFCPERMNYFHILNI